MGAEVVETLRIIGSIFWPILGFVNMLIGWFLWSLKGRFPSAERVASLEDRMKTVETKIDNMPSTHAMYSLGREIETLHGDVKSLKTALQGFDQSTKGIQRQLGMLIQHHIDLEKKS